MGRTQLQIVMVWIDEVDGFRGHPLNEYGALDYFLEMAGEFHARGRESPERASPCFPGNKQFAESVNDG